MSKKYIVTRLYTDATSMPDAAIQAFKAFMLATFGVGGFAKVDFEIVEESAASQVDRLLQSVRSEFAVHDQAETKPSEEIQGTNEQH